MRLTLCELEELHGIAQPVAREPLRPQHWIVIGDGKRRVVGPHEGTLGWRLILDFAEGIQTSGWIALKKLDPTLNAFLPSQSSRPNVGNAAELIKMLVFHRSPPVVDHDDFGSNQSKTMDVIVSDQ